MGTYLELAKRAAASAVPAIDTETPKSTATVSVLPAGIIVLQPGHRLAHFAWNAPGFDPGEPPRIIDGVTHKRSDCCSRRSWRHIWGMVLCGDCWPCTDPLAECRGGAAHG